MTRKQAIQELISKTCRCGNPKKKGHSFCLSCWRQLTFSLQNDLYQQFGAGYEEAYGRAVAFLFNDNVAGKVC